MVRTSMFVLAAAIAGSDAQLSCPGCPNSACSYACQEFCTQNDHEHMNDECYGAPCYALECPSGSSDLNATAEEQQPTLSVPSCPGCPNSACSYACQEFCTQNDHEHMNDDCYGGPCYALECPSSFSEAKQESARPMIAEMVVEEKAEAVVPVVEVNATASAPSCNSVCQSSG